MRVRFLARYLAPEMVALSVAEMLLTFFLTLVLLTPTAGSFRLSFVHPALICALTVGLVAFVIGLYRPEMFSRAKNLVFNTLLSAILSFPAVWIVTKALQLGSYWPVGYDSLRPLKIVAIWTSSVVCIRLLFLFAARCNVFLHRVALVGPNDPTSTFLASRPTRKGFLEVFTIRPDVASASELKSRGVRTLILNGHDDERQSPALAAEYRRCGIALLSQAEFSERHLRRIDVATVDDTWVESLAGSQGHRMARFFTRAFDIALSLTLVLITLPLMAALAVLVRLDSPGPVLYRQERLGLRSKPFVVLKFRSMRANAEALGPKWAQQKDPRVTRLGALMRKTRMDELPQLANILRGEMSFIGPRPERPHFVEQLRLVIPYYEQRALVKPGLTGWAQVNYPYGASVEDARAKLSYDLYYVKNRSFFLDVLILLSTVRVILFQEGAR